MPYRYNLKKSYRSPSQQILIDMPGGLDEVRIEVRALSIYFERVLFISQLQIWMNLSMISHFQIDLCKFEVVVKYIYNRAIYFATLSQMLTSIIIQLTLIYMIESSSPPKRIEQILQSIYQLLSFEEKDKSKIQRLLSIFDEAFSLKNQLKTSQLKQQEQEQELLKQCIKDIENQKAIMLQNKRLMGLDITAYKKTKQIILVIISKFLASAYQMKQLQSLINTNQRKLKVNQYLKQKSQQIKNQYELHLKSITKDYQDKGQQETLMHIKKQLENEVKLKKLQKKNLQKEIQRYKVRQQQQREQYKQLLQQQNKDKKDKIKYTKPSESFILNQRSSKKTIKQQKSINNSIPTIIEIRSKKLNYEHKVEKAVGLTLTFSTLLLVLYYLFIHQ